MTLYTDFKNVYTLHTSNRSPPNIKEHGRFEIQDI